ncbi:nitrous oxide reductase [Streptomyces sp. V4I8]|uniref:hypothetical protein n=1 Tax=Streptomyces sp. V4I8 TaxID=3156469 RepID=UPI00351638BC
MPERLKRLLVLSTTCLALAGGAAVSTAGTAAAAPSSPTAVAADAQADSHPCYWQQGYWSWEWSYYYGQWMWVWHPGYWVC